MNTVDSLMAQAFAPSRCRTPRSAVYRAGVRSILAMRIDGAAYCCPHNPGTVEADAFWSGTDEGHHICNDAGIPQRQRGPA
jgi:hypothetical protein